jgi:hypothetical protein
MGLRASRPLLTGAGGAAVAAGVTWLLDSHHGRARRAALRDRGARALALARARFGREEALSDELIADRVRARLLQLGVAAKPGVRVEVTAKDGRVALRGAVPAAVHGRVVRHVAHIGGVREVVDLLEVATELPGSADEEPWAAEGWPPPVRAFAAAAGLAAVTWAGVARTPLAIAGATLGLGFVARSAANRPLLGLLPSASRGALSLFPQ